VCLGVLVNTDAADHDIAGTQLDHSPIQLDVPSGSRTPDLGIKRL